MASWGLMDIEHWVLFDIGILTLGFAISHTPWAKGHNESGEQSGDKWTFSGNRSLASFPKSSLHGNHEVLHIGEDGVGSQ